MGDGDLHDDGRRNRPGPISTDAFARVEITRVDQLDAWLERNHASEASVWLVTHMKRAGASHVTMDEVLDVLMRHGWTDGIRRKLDGDRSMQLISRRRQRVWADTYKRRVARLEAAGSMRPWGSAAVERAKRDGTWDAMADVDALLVPADLAAALEGGGAARAMFDGCPPSYRRNLLRWLASANAQDTRLRRIAAIVAACSEGRRIPQM